MAKAIFFNFSFSFLTPMKNDPTFRNVRFPCYLTERQLALLKEIAKERGDSITELVRAAVHFLLKGMGKNDALLYTREEAVEAVVATWQGEGEGEKMRKARDEEFKGK
jgi:hypothetical protein